MDSHRAATIRRVGILLLLLAALAACGGPATEATLAPTPAPDLTVCAAGCDFTTIQAAIDAPGAAAVPVLELRDPVHTEADIQVHKSAVIQGPGPDAAQTIVQAHAEPETAGERVFTIPAGITVTLRALTIRHGNPLTTPESGGGILNEGTLRLEGCVVTANSGGAGGGIHNQGTLTAVDSTISDNVARGGHDREYECDTGGGIKNLVGTVTLINSTVSDNRARGRGGGVHVACQGSLVLVNSTISGNLTEQDGGGVYLNGLGAFTHATISDNTAKSGGGIYVLNREPRNPVIRGNLSYTNTLIAGNVALRESYPVADCHLGDDATLGENHHNFVGDGTCDAAYSGDAGLLPLGDNGGATQTHALAAGSPARDALPEAACLLDTDQRGLPRAGPCDAGAFEVQEDL